MIVIDKVLAPIRSGIKNFMLRNFSTEFRCRCWPEIYWPIKPRYMMAERGFHPDIGHQYCSTLDICQVLAVRGKYYIGHYMDGIMATGVLFPRKSTRDLEFEEKMKYQNRRIEINGAYICTIKIDY